MTSTHYTHSTTHYIYALVLPDYDGRWVYVGKTRSTRLSAIYSKHIRGHIAATAAVFAVDDKPDLYLLEIGDMTGAVAYKHVVAWTAFFWENDYYPLNHEGTMDHAQHMLPETLDIYRKISADPLQEILSRTRLEKPTAADRKKDPPCEGQKDPPCEREHLPEEKTQINFRLSLRDRNRFRDFCGKSNLHQREAFSLLLDQLQPDTAVGLTQILSQYQQSLALLKAENQKLRDQLADAKAEKMTGAAKWAVEYLPFLQNGFHRYLIELGYFETDKQKKLPSLSHKKFTRRLPPGVVYNYPPEEGYYLLTLEAVLWGNPLHKACFYVGKAPDGNPLKLRYYAKSWFCGACPKDSAYGYAGCVWLVGCKRAKDGAMDMVVALPLPEYKSQPKPQPVAPTPQKNHPSLDDQIHGAARRTY